MMTGSPVANLGAEKPKSMPNLKGTMVGVAPPDLSGTLPVGAKPVASAAAKPAPSFKGTMVGVAPPGIEDLRKQTGGSAASAPTTSSPAPGDAPAPSAAAPAKNPPAALKGTMIGLAPPNMGAEVEAAKAKLAAQKAQAAAAKATPQEASRSPEAAAVPAATAGAPSATSAGKSPPAQLKGTMIGVAPPNMQAQIAAARDAATAKRAEADAARVDNAPTDPPPAENEPPSEPDPLGGTVVGMSPFAPGGPHHAQAATPSALDFNDDTPPAGSGTPIVSREALAASQALAEEPAMQAAPLPQEVRPAPSPHYSPVDAPVGLPVKKSSAGPLVLVVVLLLIVVAGVAFLMMGKGEAEEAGDSRDPAGSTEPAKDGPKE